MASGDGSEKSAWNKMPVRMSKQDVLKTMGESKDFRNPFRLPEMGDNWPNTERVKDHEKMLGTATEWSKKGRPI